ncbi:hypothetical protein BOSEA31B_20802 [Hyphomicrobiales bacterium]|nr:hypothetical protein BOSEA31B_20802 [Hyphomicrobiales bacterium]CAH1702700.1 hypothetical protein BOSEA1005_30572 [Hyphomicrobiales bacterium]CAI0346890.1 hypothetical protein BO1005MUT1_530066 [Hyphomicrobiales bacterium]
MAPCSGPVREQSAQAGAPIAALGSVLDTSSGPEMAAAAEAGARCNQAERRPAARRFAGRPAEPASAATHAVPQALAGARHGW